MLLPKITTEKVWHADFSKDKKYKERPEKTLNTKKVSTPCKTNKTECKHTLLHEVLLSVPYYYYVSSAT